MFDSKYDHKAHLNRLRDDLMDLARRGPVPAVLELATQLTEMVGTVAGVMIARRAKECCNECQKHEAINQTANAASNIFRTYLEESAADTAKRLHMADPFPNRRKDTEARAADVKPARGYEPKAYIDIVFETMKVEGKPDEERFVEVEAPDGRSMHAGEWIERHDGHTVLRIRPEVFGPAASPAEEPEHPLEGLLQALRGHGVDVQVATNPLEAMLLMAGVNLPDTMLGKIRRASQHDKMCDCAACGIWWAYAGPHEGIPGDYGPFSREVINDRQRELGLELTP